ncbi:DUF2169 domain-containing protein [Xinfangfangia sp. CPCC 101601]|uniref:DUF2169 domain-containing protein n=1 Tax=Pseudogemmobacter lacusdianii TaxID=3069608 RepID=A0ABU0VZB9_9RHOB|nr:DUF2169 domain-containing protein [Xinfangfangia sp. CPCC 101601]MDQ2067067.1 DUF2169 domain-containing protein [Xinfangfangia sp. CPCC 101601]
MWLLHNETPFSADRTWIRDERGAEFWLVAIRASFRIGPDGVQRPTRSQTPVQMAPSFAGDPLRAEMLSDSDFALSKTGTDVLLAGRAVAPHGQPSPRVSVRLKLADIDKSLEVLGERLIYQGALGTQVTEPLPFLALPLTWAQSYGGYDPEDASRWHGENPAGRGFAAKAERLRETQAPNIEYATAPYRSGESGRTAGFGPVAHHWLPRRSFGGTYDEAWRKNRDPLLPEDFDRRYFRSAPLDQQTATPLQGYEQVRVGGVTPEGIWGFVLPRVTFDIVTSFRGARDHNQRAQIHTLWLYPDQNRFEIVYQTALHVPGGMEERLLGTALRVRPRSGTPDSVKATGVWVPQ